MLSKRFEERPTAGDVGRSLARLRTDRTVQTCASLGVEGTAPTERVPETIDDCATVPIRPRHR
jgi:hypothetical protein